MFPNPDYCPSHIPQNKVHFSVFFYIPFDFGNPVIPVCLDVLFPVFPVIAMPEITITENCYSVLLYGNIRMSIYLAVFPKAKATVPESL